MLTPAYRFLELTTPLASAVTLSLQLFVPEEMGRHVTLAGINRRGQLVWLGGSYADERLTARIRTSGDWLAVADTLPPTIRPLFESGADLARKGALRFRLGDNFSGIASCDLYVDGEWTPCERYPMQGTLEYPAAQHITEGEQKSPLPKGKRALLRLIDFIKFLINKGWLDPNRCGSDDRLADKRIRNKLHTNVHRRGYSPNQWSAPSMPAACRKRISGR